MNCSTRYVTSRHLARNSACPPRSPSLGRRAYHGPYLTANHKKLAQKNLQFAQGYLLSVSLVYLYSKLQADLFISAVCSGPATVLFKMFCQSFSAPSLQRLLCKVAILSWAFWIAAIGCVTEQGFC